MKIKPLWRHYYQNTDFIIFTLDSSDRQRLDEAIEKFYTQTRDDELYRLPVLVYVTKQDLPYAMSVQYISDKLNFNRHDKFHIQGSSSITGYGLYEGLDWIIGVLTEGTNDRSSLLKWIPALSTQPTEGIKVCCLPVV